MQLRWIHPNIHANIFGIPYILIKDLVKVSQSIQSQAKVHENQFKATEHVTNC